MRHRLLLGLIAAMPLLLAACAAPAANVLSPAQAGRSVATQPSAAPASCPTTRPPDPPFVPPTPYPPTPPSGEGDKVWYGTTELWTWLNADGTWEMAHDEHGLFDKSFWWRQGYDWRTETTPALRVTGRRLDAAAPAVTVSDATNGFEARPVARPGAGRTPRREPTRPAAASRCSRSRSPAPLRAAGSTE
jgi:hypothetical protein